MTRNPTWGQMMAVDRRGPQPLERGGWIGVSDEPGRQAYGDYTQMSDDDILRVFSQRRAKAARELNTRARIAQEEQALSLLATANPHDLIVAPVDARTAGLQRIAQDDINARERGVLTSYNWNEKAANDSIQRLNNQLAINADRRAEDSLGAKLDDREYEIAQRERKLNQNDLKIANQAKQAAARIANGNRGTTRKDVEDAIDSGEIYTPSQLRGLYPGIGADDFRVLSQRIAYANAGEDQDRAEGSRFYKQVMGTAEQYNRQLANRLASNQTSDFDSNVDFVQERLNKNKQAANQIRYDYEARRFVPVMENPAFPDPIATSSYEMQGPPAPRRSMTGQQGPAFDQSNPLMSAFNAISPARRAPFTQAARPWEGQRMMYGGRELEFSGGRWQPAAQGPSQLEGQRARNGNRILEYRSGRWVDIGAAAQ